MHLSMVFGRIRLLLTSIVCIFFLVNLNGQSLSTLDSLVAELALTTASTERIPLILKLSRESMTSDPEQGYAYANEVIDLSRVNNDNESLAKALNAAGGNLLYLSRYDESINAFSEALELYEDLGDEKSVADLAGNIGMVANQQGLLAKALEYQFIALNAFEVIPDTPGICNTNFQIGSTYYSTGDYDKALSYTSNGLSCFESTNDEYGIAMASGTLANIHSQQGNLDQSRKFHEKAIDGFSKLQSPFDLGREYGNYSTFHEQLGNLSEAILLGQKSLLIYEEYNSDLGISLSKGNIGSFYLTSAQKKIEGDTSAILPSMSLNEMLQKAASNLRQALDLSEENTDLVFVRWLSKNLADVYQLQGKYQSSLQLYKQAQSIQDSLTTIESKKEIEKLTTEREILLRDKQIELDRLAVLKKKNERIYFIIGLGLLGLVLTTLYFNYRSQVKSNSQLKSLNGKVTDINQQLETKNYSLNSALHELQETQEQLILTERQKEQAELRSRISQDIHDDISAGLTKISWLAESFQSKVSRGDTEKLIPLVNKINASSQDTVSKLSEIIWSTNPEKDSVASFLAYLRDHIHSFLEDSSIDYQIDFPEGHEETPINPKVRRNLYLIMKEALHNTFKYSEANQVIVKFDLYLNQYTLTISDNGNGFESTEAQGSGNGFQNMDSRMKDINGTIDIQSSLGSGVKITCTGQVKIES